MDTIFFVTSKVFWVLVRPETWIVGLMVLALIALWRKRILCARRLLAAGLGLTLLIGLTQAAALLLRPLENWFPARPDIAQPAGIIILGGGEDGAMSAASGQPELNGAGERLMLGLAIAREHPAARVIFTGGSGRLLEQGNDGATTAGDIFRRLGLDEARLTLEGASRNTAENATLTRQLVKDAGTGPWVLVTSAFHMPRAMGTFCAAGWRNVIPYPVDYRAAELGDINWSLAGNLDLLGIAIKEWIGLAVYRLTGRTAHLFPSAC